jgi:hypothetical protein
MTRASGCAASGDAVDGYGQSLQQRLDSLETRLADGFDPTATLYRRVQNDIFAIATQAAACPEHLAALAAYTSAVRHVVKIQSRSWNLADVPARQALYRLLYGARAALEEALLQHVLAADQTEGSWPGLVLGTDEPSQTPSTTIHGVTIHSGDVLVSRGGAAASALIARGSDYPGNFSHVALVHIDETTSTPTIVEAHIERGVAVASVDEYLADKKLRIAVLRLRPDLPQLVDDPMLPHKAASYALDEARRRHIPYDFAMNWRDPSLKFCSEVAYDAYSQHGVFLWMGMSTISRAGLVNWLSAIGVRYFETHEPSDLEYDPQLTVVAEWRDRETLRMDRIDNAIIDARLELADEGVPLGYNRLMLPATRLAKLYSMALNASGNVGPVPEGMSSATALRVTDFSAEHDALRESMFAWTADFARVHGYHPPYWRLLTAARAAVRLVN